MPTVKRETKARDTLGLPCLASSGISRLPPLPTIILKIAVAASVTLSFFFGELKKQQFNLSHKLRKLLLCINFILRVFSFNIF